MKSMSIARTSEFKVANHSDGKGIFIGYYFPGFSEKAPGNKNMPAMKDYTSLSLGMSFMLSFLCLIARKVL